MARVPRVRPRTGTRRPSPTGRTPGGARDNGNGLPTPRWFRRARRPRRAGFGWASAAGQLAAGSADPGMAPADWPGEPAGCRSGWIGVRLRPAAARHGMLRDRHNAQAAVVLERASRFRAGQTRGRAGTGAGAAAWTGRGFDGDARAGARPRPSPVRPRRRTGARRLHESPSRIDHNAQTLRVVTSLERRYPGIRRAEPDGESLEGIVKHNGPLTDRAASRSANITTAAASRLVVADFDKAFELELGAAPRWKHRSLRSPTISSTTPRDIDDGLRGPVQRRRSQGDAAHRRHDLREIDRHYPLSRPGPPRHRGWAAN